MSEHRIDETYRYEEDFITRNFNKMINGKVVTVTGTSYGMSKEMAQLMVRQGAKVFATACGEKKLDVVVADIKKKTGSDITEITTGSSKPEECKKVFEKALEAYGDTDVLINNAGEGEFITTDAVSGEVIDQVVDTNMKGLLYLCREAVGYLLKKDSRNIINISSANGIRLMYDAACCVTKDGLNALIESVAIRCTDTGIRCNVIVPGHAPNPTAYARDDGGPQTLAERVTNEMRDTRTVRSVHPWEVNRAYAVLLLASNISRRTNGEVLSVDYGYYL